jgi:hypothetical protein
MKTYQDKYILYKKDRSALIKKINDAKTSINKWISKHIIRGDLSFISNKYTSFYEKKLHKLRDELSSLHNTHSDVISYACVDDIKNLIDNLAEFCYTASYSSFEFECGKEKTTYYKFV